MTDKTMDYLKTGVICASKVTLTITADEAREILTALSEQKKGGWIPVEERKPKHKQEVFVTYETEDGLKVDKTEYHERHGFAISPTVTAWREDISPYKENDTWT